MSFCMPELCMQLFIYLDTLNHQEQCESDSYSAADGSEAIFTLHESSDEEPTEEYWDVDIEDVLRDFDQEHLVEEERLQSISHSNIVLYMMLIFLLLWASFYGISATALNHLIQFLQYILSIITPSSPTVAALLTAFPTSLYMLKKFFKIDKDAFVKYVICPKCSSLYNFNECFETGRTDKVLPKVCNHVPYRYHPHLSHRKACGHRLLREVVTKSNKKFYPLKTYCYHSIEKSMIAVLGRADLLEQCEHWRSRNIPENVLADVYDGRVWKEFLTYKGRPFLTNKHNIGLMLNCDWFQPFEHTNYSVGVLYLVILNLPRTIRFKPENVLIVGIIPGPSEPNYSEINSYLRPLVKELNSLWTEGFTLPRNGDRIVIHAALLATVCDIPATAKIGGFVGHASKHACWKCSKVFPYDPSLKRVSFSGVQLAPPRDHDTHKQNALKTLTAVTPTQRHELELGTGSRFTQLMYLPYYDCVRFSIIDPMHNMFLGTTKRILHQQWLESGLISRKQLDEIQTIVAKCKIPCSAGRIPYKIASAFKSLTAEEWKNWTLLFSLIALKNVLPEDHLQCWQKYVSACSIFCSSILTLNEINTADNLMKSFF